MLREIEKVISMVNVIDNDIERSTTLEGRMLIDSLLNILKNDLTKVMLHNKTMASKLLEASIHKEFSKQDMD